MRMTSKLRVFAAVALAAIWVSNARPDTVLAQGRAHSASLFADAPNLRWNLPNHLYEISGLALTPDGRVFAHDDERAEVYQLDYIHQSIAKRFRLGDPVVRGDFEDIAISDAGQFFLITSDGLLYSFSEGADRARVEYQQTDVGLRQICEIEGLAFVRADESLIIACKTNYTAPMRHSIALYKWSLRDRRLRLWLNLPETPIDDALGLRGFHPSAIALDPRSGRMIVLAAREHAMIELSATGALLAERSLGDEHRQAEGVVVLSNGDLLLSDEGAGGRALLTRYPRGRH
jgi:uncharacterized protein YjiK